MINLFSNALVNYCELAGDTFLSEPLNLFSNLAFFGSAYMVYKLYKDMNVKKFYYWFLFAMLIIIGTGSSLWHSIRNPYTHVLDAVPIFIFLLSLLFLLIHTIVESSWKSFGIVAAFFLLQLGLSYFFPKVLNG